MNIKHTYKAVVFVIILMASILQLYGADVLVLPMPEIESPDVSFAMQLEDALAKTGVSGALELFGDMPEALDDDVDILCLKASLLVSAGRTKDAEELGNRLMAISPNSVPVLEVNAMIAKASQNKTKQTSIIKQLLAIDPYNSEANVELAQNEMLKHNYKSAYKYYRTSIEKEPDNITGLAGVGQTSYYLGKISDAKVAFKKILAADEHNDVALAYMGKLEAENENYKKALEYINEAIKYNANSYSYYLDCGTYSRNLGKFDDAIVSWSKAIEIDPDYFLAYAYRGGIYDEQKKYSNALSDYKKVVQTNPDYYFAYEALGILAWHEKDWKEARKAFELARSMMNSNVSYPLIIAATYLKEGKNVECKNFLDKAMKGFDRSSLDYIILRLFHDGGGINAENEVTLRVKNESNTNKRGKMMYYMGLFYDIKGSKTLANEFYTGVLKLNCPTFFEYRLAEWSTEK